MEKPIKKDGSTSPPKNNEQAASVFMPLNRRNFVGTITSAAVAITIVPRHVLGGNGFVAPSDKTTLAYIGVGTQGLRELLPLLDIPELQIIACLLYTSDAADEEDSVDVGGRRIIKIKKK